MKSLLSIAWQMEGMLSCINLKNTEILTALGFAVCAELKIGKHV
jgi:hypothetical protein